MRTLLCFILFLGMTGQIFAQEPVTEEEEPMIDPDRPGATYSPTAMPKGYIQVEMGLGLDVEDSSDTWTLPALDLRYGLAKNFELRAGFRGTGAKKWGFGEDMSFDGSMLAGFKWGIINTNVQLTYLAEVEVPLFPGIVSAHHQIGFTHTHSVVQINYMVYHNYDFSKLNVVGYGGELQFALNINVMIAPKWGFYVGGTPNWDSSDPTNCKVLFDAGITYLVKKNLQLDFFFGHGLNYKHGMYGLGISWMPYKKERKFKEDSASAGS